GHHPHIVGPVERYKERVIAYSLGNWAFSYGKFFGGKLRFPEASFSQLAIELGDDKVLAHHAIFVPPNTIQYRETEDVFSSSFSLRAPFEGFDDRQYESWFREHRIKRRLLPVYRTANA